MTDNYYKFLDEQAMLDALRPLGMTYTDDEGNTQVSQGSHQYAAWVVGTIANYEGYHLNVRQIDPDFDLSSLDMNEVHPADPRVIWA
jgi:hypothetical protein